METFTTVITSAIAGVTEAMKLLTSEPVVYFVALAAVAATIGVVKKLLPMKKG